jgi:hypothetical protein
MSLHEETPEGESLGDGMGGGKSEEEELYPDQEDPVSLALGVLQTRLTKILKHAHTDQGLLAIDLVSCLHQVLGQVVSWGMVEALEGDDDEDDFEGPDEDPDIEPQDWTPESDLPQDDDDEDVDDQGDPRKPVSV